VAERVVEEKTNRLRWSGHDVALGLSLFPEFIRSVKHRRLAARSLRQATRWMISWALGEVYDAKDAMRWKKLVGQVDGNLAAYGSGVIGGLLFLGRSSRIEMRRDLLIRIMVLLPCSVAIAYGKRLRGRTEAIRGELLKENQ
jgi:hypothetical protein